jgi:hypothetical protein
MSGTCSLRPGEINMERYLTVGRTRARWAVGVVVWVTVTLTVSPHMTRAGQCRLRDSEVTRLLGILRDQHVRETDPYRVREAMRELGEARCAEAVGDLVKLLDYRFKFNWEGGKVRIQPIFVSTRYPAVGALIQIGEPALPEVTRAIGQNPPDSLIARNAAYAVKGIFAGKTEPAVKYLTQAADSESDREQADRLRQAADLIPSINLLQQEPSQH